MAKKPIAESEDKFEIKGVVEPTQEPPPQPQPPPPQPEPPPMPSPDPTTAPAPPPQPDPPSANLAYTPVAVGVRKRSLPPLTTQMVNTRASHFYFRRMNQLLRAMRKYQRA